ncbi:hypothetical protein DK37_19490 [Halomonas sp. SUBG004]|nr:hypothetical protein DK37_19490 [Halomonas sp. SUBG004]
MMAVPAESPALLVTIAWHVFFDGLEFFLRFDHGQFLWGVAARHLSKDWLSPQRVSLQLGWCSYSV